MTQDGDEFAAARARFITALKQARLQSAHDDASRVLHYAREALMASFDLLPVMIKDRTPEADARILTRAELRTLLAEFAVDLLIAQSEVVLRWISARSEARKLVVEPEASEPEESA